MCAASMYNTVSSMSTNSHLVCPDHYCIFDRDHHNPHSILDLGCSLRLLRHRQFKSSHQPTYHVAFFMPSATHAPPAKLDAENTYLHSLCQTVFITVEVVQRVGTRRATSSHGRNHLFLHAVSIYILDYEDRSTSPCFRPLADGICVATAHAQMFPQRSKLSRSL
jgi:hypothetical protein